MRRLLGLLGMAVVLAAACSGGSGSTPTPGAAPIVFHAVPADAVGVSGNATCDLAPGMGVSPEGGTGFLATCELDLSDPRVSGTERHDRFRFYEAGEVAAVWVAEEAVLTNAEGTWRGAAQAADDTFPCGEAHYLGEGAYAGLEFHYYFCHISDEIWLRGWISGGG